jgi:uncharacterized protein YjiS (DUF1127 family)
LFDEGKFTNYTTLRTTIHSFTVEITVMKMFSLTRFLRRRRTYRNVLQELSSYSDHELHEIGIDHADFLEIARRTSQELR